MGYQISSRFYTNGLPSLDSGGVYDRMVYSACDPEPKWNKEQNGREESTGGLVSPWGVCVSNEWPCAWLEHVNKETI